MNFQDHPQSIAPKGKGVHLTLKKIMHEGYAIWVVKLQILKQILNCIMLKYSCVLHHLQCMTSFMLWSWNDMHHAITLVLL